MANFVYIATSLDGYIAGQKGEIDWLDSFPDPDTPESDFGYGEFINRVDALLMGKNTFDKVLTFGEWPYEKRVFVLSHSLKEVPAHLTGKVQIVSGEIEEVLQDLSDQGYKDLYIDGGKVIRDFLRKDLIEEMYITRLPILLGQGIPLFGKMNNPVRFNKVESIVLNKYLVMSRYAK